MRKLLFILVLLLAILGAWTLFSAYIPLIFSKLSISSKLTVPSEQIKVLTEESVVISDVKKISPSVVTVEEFSQSSSANQSTNFGPFQIFGFNQGQQQNNPQAIGSGFVVSGDGLVVTNKHVVSDTNATYNIITSDNKKYAVVKVYRDPLNDIAFLKIDLGQNVSESLKPVPLGDSSNLQVGQFVVAIGTALGEFNNTVTTGVISGLGRAITAGDQFQGYVENLTNVIQTDAPINPGNSGGPLVNSSGEVIGINTAIAQNGQNIGFSLPVNLLKESLNNFNQHGQFYRPYLGVSYEMLDKNTSALNELVQGAYVQSVVSFSPADKAGIQQGDVITKFDGKTVEVNGGELSALIASKKVGNSVNIQVWRSGNNINLQVTLTSAPNQ
jgi:serine protease Do